MATVVVTGGARGIGDAIVRAFVGRGDDVISLDLSDPADALEGVTYIHADVTNPECVGAAADGLDRVDVLVNNAGIQRVGLIGEMAHEDWLAVIATHLTGAYVCNSAVVPLMRRQRSGAIIHIASAAAFVGLPGRGPYSAAKAGLLALTRVMAVELATYGVRVNAVAPGFTRTTLIQQGIDDGSLEEDWMVERVPMARLATPEEIARVVCFLASDDASFVTGQCLLADGGWTVQGITHAPDWLSRVDAP
jgi:NAD(P)-dependent dehydrogenase (short-subunit alcohol dehydrogenase family)